MRRIVVVIGAGGSAGLHAANAAVKSGAAVIGVEARSWASFCVDSGCMPKIISHEVSGALDARHMAARRGFVKDNVAGQLDWSGIRTHEKAIQARFRKARLEKAFGAPFKRINGSVFFNKEGLPVIDGSPYHAAAVVVATGSEAIEPNETVLPGFDADMPYMISDDFLRLERMPKSLAVIGGGVIGLELSQQAAHKGARVKVFCRSSLLHRIDVQVGKVLQRALQDATEGLTIATHTLIKRITYTDGKFILTSGTANGSDITESFGAMLVALGRRACLPPGLGELDIKLNPDGSLWHDTHMQTSLPQIYCAGDVTGKPMLLHEAKREGEVAGTNAARGRATIRIKRRHLQAIYVEPAFATVGLSEAQARAEGREVWTHCLDLSCVGRYIAQGVRYGAWKVVTDAATGVILGSQIVAPGADSEIQLMHCMIENQDSLEAVRDKYDFLHPSRAEAILNIVDAWQEARTSKKKI